MEPHGIKWVPMKANKRSLMKPTDVNQIQWTHMEPPQYPYSQMEHLVTHRTHGTHFIGAPRNPTAPNGFRLTTMGAHVVAWNTMFLCHAISYRWQKSGERELKVFKEW